jgi:hypothetical protein
MENTESAAKSLAVISACVSQDEASLRILMRDKSYWKVLNILNIRGLAPLHVALNSRNMNIVRLLIEHGAELTLLDANGDTPLHRACRIGFFEAVEFLCSFRDVGVEMLNSRGQTPLEVALEVRSSEISYEDRYGTIIVDYEGINGDKTKSEEESGRQKCVAFLEKKIREGKNARESDYLLETIRLNQLKMRITEILRNTGPGRHKNYVANYVSPASGDWTVRDYNTFYSNINNFNMMAASVAASGVVVAAMNSAYHSIDQATTKRAAITRNKILLEEITYKEDHEKAGERVTSDDATQLEEDMNEKIDDMTLEPLTLPSIEEIVEAELVYPMIWKGINIIVNEGNLGSFDISNRKARRIRAPKSAGDRGPQNASRRRDIRNDKAQPRDLPTSLVQSVIVNGMDSVSIEAALESPQPFAVFCKDLVHNLVASGIRAVANRDLSALTDVVGPSTACEILDAGMDSMRRDNYDALKSASASLAKSLMLKVFANVYNKNAKLRGGLVTIDNQAVIIKHATLFVEDILERGLHSFSTDFSPSNRAFVGETSASMDEYVAKCVISGVSKEVDNATVKSVGSIVEDIASALVSLVTSEALHRVVDNKSVSVLVPAASYEGRQEYIMNFSKALVEEIISNGVSSLGRDDLESSGSEVQIVSHVIGIGLDTFNKGKNKGVYISDIVSTIEGHATSRTTEKTATPRVPSVRTIAADFIEDIIKCGLKSLVQPVSHNDARGNADAVIASAINHANVVAKSAISAIISDGLVSASIAYSNKAKSSRMGMGNVPDTVLHPSQSDDSARRDFIAGLIGDVILQGIRRHADGVHVVKPFASRRPGETGATEIDAMTERQKMSSRASGSHLQAVAGSGGAESATNGKNAGPHVINDGSDHNGRVPSSSNVSRPGSAGDAFSGPTAFITT